MNGRLFKPSVSDWKFIFENNVEVKIVTISEQIISCRSGGRFFIILEDVSFDKDMIFLTRNGNKIKSLSENFVLVSGDGKFSETIEYEYKNPEIIKTVEKSDAGSITTLKLYIRA